MQRTTFTVLAGLILVSFVLPFSYLPNPVGLVYTMSGGYAYSPRLHFLANGFAILNRGDVEAALRTKLDRLLGATGLDPLDPNQPLQSYEIETVSYGDSDWGIGSVRMTYADGSSRRYEIPVVQHSQSWGRPGNWAYTGLDRYFAPHREVPYLRFAAADDPVHLGKPQRLPLDEATHQLGASVLVGWYTSETRPGEDLVWAPDGSAFLLATFSERWRQGASGELWVVQLDTQVSTRLASNVQGYAWSSDSSHIVYLRAVDAVPGRAWEVVACGRDGQGQRVLARTDLAAQPVVVGDVVFYLADKAFWRTSVEGGNPTRVCELPGLWSNYPVHSSFAVAPGGQRLAYRCGDDLCLIDADGQNHVRIGLGAPPRLSTPAPTPSSSSPPPPPTAAPTAPPATPLPAGPVPQRPGYALLALAWSPVGDRLAAVASDYAEGAMPTLWLLDREGRVLQRVIVGPNGLTRAPQWTPNGRWVFLNTFPEAGRRMLAVEASSREVYDLSQPRWDTFFSLSPDGQRLLLWNGRGGFWTVEVLTD